MTIPARDRYRIEDLPERIRSKIWVNPRTGCWEWQGRRDNRPRNGYGQIKWHRADGTATVLSVHRVVWALLAGPIPDGHQVNHVPARGCRSKACCWPAHLEAVQMGYGKGLPGRICEHAGAGPDLLPAPAGERELHLAVPAGTREASSGAPADLVIHVHLHFGRGE